MIHFYPNLVIKLAQISPKMVVKNGMYDTLPPDILSPDTLPPTLYPRHFTPYCRVVHKNQKCPNNYRSRLICCSIGQITTSKKFLVQLDRETPPSATPLFLAEF